MTLFYQRVCVTRKIWKVFCLQDYLKQKGMFVFFLLYICTSFFFPLVIEVIFISTVAKFQCELMWFQIFKVIFRIKLSFSPCLLIFHSYLDKIKYSMETTGLWFLWRFYRDIIFIIKLFNYISFSLHFFNLNLSVFSQL